jgi:hypothetical protein
MNWSTQSFALMTIVFTIIQINKYKKYNTNEVIKKFFCIFKIVIPIYYDLKVKQIFSDIQKEKTTMTFELL